MTTACPQAPPDASTPEGEPFGRNSAGAAGSAPPARPHTAAEEALEQPSRVPFHTVRVMFTPDGAVTVGSVGGVSRGPEQRLDRMTASARGSGPSTKNHRETGRQ